MTDSNAVQITEQRHVSQFNASGQVVRSTRVTIMVGQLGPFSHDFPVGEDSPPQIQTWIQNQKAAVVGLQNAIK